MLSQYFKKKEKVPDENPYSVNNFVVPEEPPVIEVKSKGVYRV
jgi:hypothetical protein